MRILVTGRHGQLVRSLVERASDRGATEIIAIGRPEVDLGDPSSVARAIRAAAPDLVINAAAYTAVDQAEDEPELAMRVNAAGAGAAAAAAREVGAPIIQISTDYVFDGAAGAPYDEAAPTGPLNVYGRTKLRGEEEVRRANPDWLIVRTAWVVSPFGRNFVKSIIAAAAERDRLTVVDDQRGSPTSALALADALLHIAERLEAGERASLGQIYHVTGRGGISWCQLARQVMAECRSRGLATAEVLPIASEQWPTRARRPRNTVLDCGKFEREFAYPLPNWESSVGEIVGRIAGGG